MDRKKKEHNYSASDHTWLICAYQESSYLEDCIRSIKAQTIRSAVYITTSTPNALILSLAKKYDTEVLINPERSCIGRDWDFALQAGETELLTIAHQDDMYEPCYTEEVLRLFNKTKNPIIYYTNYGEIRNGNRIIRNRLLTTKRMLSLPTRLFPGVKRARRLSLAFGNSVCCPSITYRKSIMQDYSFGTHFKSNMDWELLEKLSRLEGRFIYNPRICMYHRIHEESTTSKLIGDNLRTKEDYEMLKKFWPEKIAGKLSKHYVAAEKSNEV